MSHRVDQIDKSYWNRTSLFWFHVITMLQLNIPNIDYSSTFKPYWLTAVTIITISSHNMTLDVAIPALRSTLQYWKYEKAVWLNLVVNYNYYNITISIISILRNGQFIFLTMELSWGYVFTEYIIYNIYSIYTDKTLIFTFLDISLKQPESHLGISMLGE